MTADNVAIPFGEIKNVRPRDDQRIVHTICPFLPGFWGILHSQRYISFAY